METLSYCQLMERCLAAEERVVELAAENVGLKDCIVKYAPAVEHWNAWADAEDKIQRAPETPATDSIYAGIKADGVGLLYASKAAQWPEGYLVEADEFAAQLRNGGAS